MERVWRFLSATDARIRTEKKLRIDEISSLLETLEREAGKNRTEMQVRNALFFINRSRHLLDEERVKALVLQMLNSEDGGVRTEAAMIIAVNALAHGGDAAEAVKSVRAALARGVDSANREYLIDFVNRPALLNR